MNLGWKLAAHIRNRAPNSFSTVITPSGSQWPPGYSRRRSRRAGRAVRSGGDERAVSQEWDRPATVELCGGAYVVSEADIDQLSAPGAVAKRGRDIVGNRPICGRCGVCFGGEILLIVSHARRQICHNVAYRIVPPRQGLGCSPERRALWLRGKPALSVQRERRDCPARTTIPPRDLQR